MTRRLLLLLALGAMSACHRGGATKADPQATASAVPKIEAAKALALASSQGGSRINNLIIQAQGQAKLNPGKIDPWIILGRLWVRKARETTDPGFYLNANACADVALEIVPDDRLALGLRGLVLLNDHKFEEARALSQKIADRSPDDPTVYANLSDALLELGRFDEAASAVQRMVDLKPNLPSYSRAAYVRWLQGDAHGAKKIVRLAIGAGGDSRDPEPQAWVLVQAATIFWHEGDYAGAAQGLEMVSTLVPDYPPAMVLEGRLALAKNDPKRAVELFEKAHKASPLVETAWLLGDARTLAGDVKGADDAYAIVEKDGRLTDGRTLALFFATKNKNAKEALSLAEAERKVRGDLYTDDALAWALYRNARFADAKVAIDRTLFHGTKDARLLYHSGAIRAALGDVEGGNGQIAEALRLNPKFDVTGEAEAAKILGYMPKKPELPAKP